jgi:hypothetical protein
MRRHAALSPSSERKCGFHAFGFRANSRGWRTRGFSRCVRSPDQPPRGNQRDLRPKSFEGSPQALEALVNRLSCNT